MKRKLIFAGLSLLLIMSIIGLGGCAQNKSLITLTAPQDGQELYDASSWQITWQADTKVSEVLLFLRAVDEKWDPEIGRVEASTGNFTYEAGFLRKTDYYLTIHASRFADGAVIPEGQQASHQIRVRVKQNPNAVLKEDELVLVKITYPKEEQTLKRGGAYRITWIYAPGVEKVLVNVPGQKDVIVDADQREYTFTVPPYFNGHPFYGGKNRDTIIVGAKESKQTREAYQALKDARQSKDALMAVLIKKYGEGSGRRVFNIFEDATKEEREQYYDLSLEYDRLEKILFRYEVSDRVPIKIK